MKKFSINMMVPSSTSYLSFIRQILPAFRKSGMLRSDALVRKLTLCLVEAFDNAVFHAHGGKEKKSVGIKIEIGGRQIVLEVKDEGKGFNLKKIKDPELCQVNGRGIYIIRSLMDKVEYKRNTLKMSMRPK